MFGWIEVLDSHLGCLDGTGSADVRVETRHIRENADLDWDCRLGPGLCLRIRSANTENNGERRRKQNGFIHRHTRYCRGLEWSGLEWI